jgi:hypothetical protein
MAVEGYTPVEPGSTVIPLPALVWSPELVDYASHPAYRDMVARPRFGVRAGALATFLSSMAVLLVKRVVRYEMIPNDIRSDASFGGRLKMIGQAVANAFSRPRARAERIRRVDGSAGRMGPHGIHVVTMPAAELTALTAAAAPQFDALLARREQRQAGKRAFEESRGRTTRQEQQALFDIIEKVLRDAGVMAIASAYMQREGRVIDVNPQINDVSDTFWKDIFPDTPPSELPAAAYCHRDASGGDLKAIIYMTDVEPQTGPFSYVVGSHRMQISRVDDLICEANDSNGLAGTDALTREKFAALPAKFRQKGAFGNDLGENSAFAQDITRGLWSITAPKGSIVLFDTKGIHRGGMVESGERRVITCVIG